MFQAFFSQLAECASHLSVSQQDNQISYLCSHSPSVLLLSLVSSSSLPSPPAWPPVSLLLTQLHFSPAHIHHHGPFMLLDPCYERAALMHKNRIPYEKLLVSLRLFLSIHFLVGIATTRQGRNSGVHSVQKWSSSREYRDV